MSLLTIPIGIGAALSIPTITALLVGSVAAEQAGTASGVLNTRSRTGGALAVAIFGAFVAHQEAFLQGMRVSLLMAVLLLLVTAASLSPRRDHERRVFKAQGTHLGMRQRR